MGRSPLLLDANVSYPVLLGLRELGWDAVHVKDIGMRTAKDPEIFEAAVESGRIVLTSDFSDFKNLDAAFRVAGRKHPGIILTPERPIGEIIRRLEAFDFSQIASTIRYL